MMDTELPLASSRVLALLSNALDWQAMAEDFAKEGFRVAERADAVQEVCRPAAPDRALVVVLADLDFVDGSDSRTLEQLAGEERNDDVVLILLGSSGSCAASCPSIRDRADVHLVKPVSRQNLVSIIRAATDSAEQRRILRRDVQSRCSAIGDIVAGSFEIRTLDQARNLSTMLSLACPEPDRVAVGIVELMVNAIEHGNLEIGYDLKTELLESGRWAEEIAARLESPEYGRRVVKVDFLKSSERIEMRVSDEGPGFDPAPFRCAGPRLFKDNHGRGLLIATNGCFDEIEFFGRGNVVKVRIACIRH